MTEVLLLAISVLVPTPATQANPVVVEVGTGMSAPELAALLGETLVVALLLARRGFRFTRVFFTWIPVTLLTYWFFVAGSALTLSGLAGIVPRPPAWSTVPVLVVFEALVILLETFVILRLAPHELYRTGGAVFPGRSALGIAVAGNAVSVVLGLVWLLAI